MKVSREKEFSPVGTDFDEDLLEQLRDPENAAYFIMAAMEENDADYLKIALGKVAKVHGISNVSKLTDLPRQTLYRMLAPDGNPSLDNIQQILEACGLAFAVVPKERLKEFLHLESKAVGSVDTDTPLKSQLTEIAGDLAKIGGQLKSVAKQLYPIRRKAVSRKRRKAR